MIYGVLFLSLVTLVAVGGWEILRQVGTALVWKCRPPAGLGDEVQVGDCRGTVVRLGWTHMHLQSQEGTGVLLPNTQVLRLPLVTVRGQGESDPVELVIPVPADVSPQLALEAARQAIRVSPYLALDRPLRVVLEYQADAGLAVRIHAGVFDPAHRDALINLAIQYLHRYLTERSENPDAA